VYADLEEDYSMLLAERLRRPIDSPKVRKSEDLSRLTKIRGTGSFDFYYQCFSFSLNLYFCCRCFYP